MNRREPHGAIASMTGLELKRIREESGLTQRALGELLGITNVEVYRKECGARAITKVQELAMRWIEHAAKKRGRK